MQDPDKICISRNMAFIIGSILFILLVVLFANYINSQQLSSRSRAAAADLNAMPNGSYEARLNQITAACQQLKGYLAWTGKNDSGNTVFDRFTGRYYSLEQINPVVTPPVGERLAGYCAVSGKPAGNWCEGIKAETACKADCVWLVCNRCAPKGIDVGLICPRS